MDDYDLAIEIVLGLLGFTAIAACVTLALLICGNGETRYRRRCCARKPAEEALETSRDRVQRNTMRRLWADLAHRTHHLVVSATHNLPDAAAVEASLRVTLFEIATSYGCHFGKDVIAELGTLLGGHADGLARFLAANCESSSIRTSIGRDWRKNCNKIAECLCRTNPRWAFSLMQPILTLYLEDIEVLVAARIRGDWADAEKCQDNLVTQAILIAGELSDGVAAKYSRLNSLSISDYSTAS